MSEQDIKVMRHYSELKCSELECLFGFNPDKMSQIENGPTVSSPEPLTRLHQAITDLNTPTQQEMNKLHPLSIERPHTQDAEILETDNLHRYTLQEITNILEKSLDENPVINLSKETECAKPDKVKYIPNKRAKICSKNCPAHDYSKASGRSTQRDARAGLICEWCKQKFPGDDRITPEKALTYIVEEIARELLGMKKPFYSKITNYVLASNAGKLYLDKDWFVISQVHLKLIIDIVLPGMKHPMSNIPMYLRRSALKYRKDPYSKRPTVTLNPQSDLAKELKSNTKKSWRYRFYFDDLEGFKDWRDWRKAIEDAKTAKLLGTPDKS